MFVPVHGLDGTIRVALTDFATTIAVDDNSLCLLQQRIQGSDYTYIMVQTGYSYEIVKMTGFVGQQINVIRAQDRTVAQNFPAGAQIKFVLSESAVADIINEKMLGQINIQGEGIVTVTKNDTNTFTISAPEVTLTSTSDKILVGGEFPDFVISAPVMGDCCS